MLKYGRICTSHGQTCQDMAKLFSITPKYGLVMPWYEQSKLSYNMKRPIYGQGKMCKDLTKKYQMALISEWPDLLLTDLWVYTFDIILAILLKRITKFCMILPMMHVCKGFEFGNFF